MTKTQVTYTINRDNKLGNKVTLRGRMSLEAACEDVDRLSRLLPYHKDDYYLEKVTTTTETVRLKKVVKTVWVEEENG